MSFTIDHRRLEKEYTVIRKDEQEEQIEIRVGTRFDTLHTDRFDLLTEIKKRKSTSQATRGEFRKSSFRPASARVRSIFSSDRKVPTSPIV